MAAQKLVFGLDCLMNYPPSWLFCQAQLLHLLGIYTDA